MAEWTDKTKFKFVGRSGLQYSADFSCSRPIDAAERLVGEFYQTHGAMFKSKDDGHTLRFIRGREWISRFSPVLPLSERWLKQTIAVSLSEQGPSLAVAIRYDVRPFYSVAFAPSPLVKEVLELRRTLTAP